MTDPTDLIEQLEAAEDAFGHAHGSPTFEPEINAAPDADEGEVQIQKACRLLKMIREIEDIGEYYGTILESSFIVIEHTFIGYLIVITDADPRELRDHDSPYDFAEGQIPLEADTIQRLKALYDNRRTEHYYGTSVTTEQQAVQMRSVAEMIHSMIIAFDPATERYCQCPSGDA